MNSIIEDLLSKRLREILDEYARVIIVENRDYYSSGGIVIKIFMIAVIPSKEIVTHTVEVLVIKADDPSNQIVSISEKYDALIEKAFKNIIKNIKRRK